MFHQQACSSGTLSGANVVLVLFFFFLFLGGLSLSYHLLPVSSSSGIVSIGVLLLVWRWWMCLVVLVMRGAVVSLDVDGTSTLWGVSGTTLWGGLCLRMLVNCFKTLACFNFCSQSNFVFPFDSSLANSSAAIIVSSPSEIVGASYNGSEKFYRARNACGSCVVYEILPTTVVFHSGTQVPSVYRMRRPWCPSSCGLIY